MQALYRAVRPYASGSPISIERLLCEAGVRNRSRLHLRAGQHKIVEQISQQSRDVRLRSILRLQRVSRYRRKSYLTSRTPRVMSKNWLIEAMSNICGWIATIIAVAAQRPLSVRQPSCGGQSTTTTTTSYRSATSSNARATRVKNNPSLHTAVRHQGLRRRVFELHQLEVTGNEIEPIEKGRPNDLVERAPLASNRIARIAAGWTARPSLEGRRVGPKGCLGHRGRWPRHDNIVKRYAARNARMSWSFRIRHLKSVTAITPLRPARGEDQQLPHLIDLSECIGRPLLALSGISPSPAKLIFQSVESNANVGKLRQALGMATQRQIPAWAASAACAAAIVPTTAWRHLRRAGRVLRAGARPYGRWGRQR